MDYIFTLWDIFNENIGNVLDLWDTVSQAIKSIWENLLKPVFEKVMEWVRKLFDKFKEYMPQIQRVVDEVFGMIKSAWETALKPAFAQAFFSRSTSAFTNVSAMNRSYTPVLEKSIPHAF